MAPLDTRLTPILVSVLTDTGQFQEPKLERIVGKRYIPGSNEWQMVACFEFGPENARESRCEDGFRILPLDNGSWIVTIDYRGIQRWRELSLSEVK